MFKGIVKMFNLQGTSNPQGAGGSLDSWTPPKTYPFDWWQRNMKGKDTNANTTVEACVATISQTLSMLPLQHTKRLPSGEIEILENSHASKVIRKPSPFQTKSEFLVDIVRTLLLEGNGYAIATRNGNYQIDALYPVRRLSPMVSPDYKEVYYSGGGYDLFQPEEMIPARNVLHLRMHTTTHPLKGETPLTNAALSASTGTSIQGHTNRFFENMARPSGVLETDMTLTKEQANQLREMFNDVATGQDTGGMPILTAGLKYHPLTMSATDAEIIKAYDMSREDIASVFRVPPMLLGMDAKQTSVNAEQILKFWVSTGLGFIMEHIENRLDTLFDLPVNEHLNFDTDFILSPNFKDRIDGYKSAVTGGLMTPNEFRAKEGLAPTDGGDKCYIQQQNVPLDVSTELAEATIAASKKTVAGSGEKLPPKEEELKDKELAIYMAKAMTKIERTM